VNSPNVFHRFINLFRETKITIKNDYLFILGLFYRLMKHVRDDVNADSDTQILKLTYGNQFKSQLAIRTNL